MSIFIYVHGANGSGKTTLARALIEHAGGITELKGHLTYTKSNLILLGKYPHDVASGGVDTIHPYSNVPVLAEQICKVPKAVVFAEGMVTPGTATVKQLASFYDEFLFIHLVTPIDQCIANTIKRRTARGNKKPFNPANLLNKARSARYLAGKLRREGLQVVDATYDEAWGMCIKRIPKKTPSPLPKRHSFF